MRSIKLKHRKYIRLAAVIVLAAIIVALTPVHAAERKRVVQEVDVILASAGMPLTNLAGQLINSTTYVSARNYANNMGGEYYLDGKTAIVKTDSVVISIRENSQYIVANGHYIYSPAEILTIDNEIYVPVRVMSSAFGTGVIWLQKERKVYITGQEAPPTKSLSYSEEDLYWMSRIIQAEAGGEPFEGKIAVGNVVMNRYESEWYPNTVKGVIFDKRSGVQFTPAYSGAINNTPSKESIAAAAIALENGADIAGEALYFANTMKCWAGRNRNVAATVGRHIFFL